LVGVLSLAGFMYLSNEAGEPGGVAELPRVQMGNVVTTRQDIAPRVQILPEMLQVVQMPSEFIHPLAVMSLDDAVNMLTLVPVNSGVQLLRTAIADPNTDFLSYRLNEGHVAFTVPVSDITSAGGMIRVGDQVNVMGLFAEDVAGEALSKFFLYDINVIAVGRDLAMNASAPAEGFSSMTLEVTPESAQKLAWAQNHGTITFVLKSAMDGEASEILEAVTAESLFGGRQDFRDLEYLELLTRMTALRGAEEGLLEFGHGDVTQVRRELGYDRFFWDNLNPARPPVRR